MNSFLLAATVVGLAAGLAGFTGFGFSLLAVPLLALTIDPHTAVVTGLVISAAVSVTIVVTRFGDIDLALVGVLAVASIPGVVLGAYAFRALSDTGLQLAVAIATIACALVVRRSDRSDRNTLPWLGRPAPSLATGLVSGIFSSTTGMGGPPIVAYLSVVRSQASVIRASVSTYALVAGVMSLVTLTLTGGITAGDLGPTLMALPAAGLGVFAGITAFNRWANHHAAVSALSLAGVGLLAMALAINASWKAWA